jgi:squalene-hopene/tetraprenyl-beta-curcumene cyclase
VLNALILAWDDAPTGRLSADAATAFDHMWAEQRTTGDNPGAWTWLNFDLAPWENSDAQYYGAALAALATGIAPGNYHALPQIKSHLQLLRDYLARNYAAQPLHHRLIVLWASTKVPGLLDETERRSLIEEVLGAQNTDGGWSLSRLLTRSSNRSALLRDPDSDGYATGLVALVLKQTAMPGAAPQVQRGLMWLVRNQGGLSIHLGDEFWVAGSLNRRRIPWSNVGRFMSDAATAYAVLALTEPPGPQPGVAALRSERRSAPELPDVKPCPPEDIVAATRIIPGDCR